MLLFADGGNQVDIAADLAHDERLHLAIGKRSESVEGIVVLPER